MVLKTKIIIGLAIVICLVISFGTGYNRGKKSIDVQTDTVKIEHYITEHTPKYEQENKLTIQKIKVPNIAILDDNCTIDSLSSVISNLKRDNDSLEVELYRIQRYYKTNDYEAWVSGIDPTLDSIRIKQHVEYITKTQTITDDKFHFNVGINGDLWFGRSTILNPNLNVSYRYKKVTFMGAVGASIPTNNTSGTLPYFKIGINYSIWSF